MEDPNINSHAYEHLIFDKEARNTHWKKKASSTHCAGQTRCLHVEECKQIHIHHPNKQLKPKWIKNLYLKPKKWNLVKESVGNSLKLTDTRDNFLGRTLIVPVLKSTINKWDLMKRKRT